MSLPNVSHNRVSSGVPSVGALSDIEHLSTSAVYDPALGIIMNVQQIPTEREMVNLLNQRIGTKYFVASNRSIRVAKSSVEEFKSDTSLPSMSSIREPVKLDRLANSAQTLVDEVFLGILRGEGSVDALPPSLRPSLVVTEISAKDGSDLQAPKATETAETETASQAEKPKPREFSKKVKVIVIIALAVLFVAFMPVIIPIAILAGIILMTKSKSKESEEAIVPQERAKPEKAEEVN